MIKSGKRLANGNCSDLDLEITFDDPTRPRFGPRKNGPQKPARQKGKMGGVQQSFFAVDNASLSGKEGMRYVHSTNVGMKTVPFTPRKALDQILGQENIVIERLERSEDGVVTAYFLLGDDMVNLQAYQSNEEGNEPELSIYLCGASLGEPKLLGNRSYNILTFDQRFLGRNLKSLLGLHNQTTRGNLEGHKEGVINFDNGAIQSQLITVQKPITEDNYATDHPWSGIAADYTQG